MYDVFHVSIEAEVTNPSFVPGLSQLMKECKIERVLTGGHTVVGVDIMTAPRLGNISSAFLDYAKRNNRALKHLKINAHME